jgi:outer membrane receptor for ferrienterochelin and colicins
MTSILPAAAPRLRRHAHLDAPPACAPRLSALAAAACLAWPAAHAQSLPAPADQAVVITATRHAMLAIDAPASLSVVRREDIEARGADNVLEAVRSEPGLSLQGRAIGGRKVMGLRGLDARHTLYLQNGQRINASDGVVGASDFQYDWLAADDIERIEVVRGPLSVLYGSEALGGVINVITRDPGKTWRLGTLAEGSQAEGSRGGDGWRAAVRADGPLGGGLALRVGAAASQLEPLASPADARISELEGRDKRDAWASLHWAAGESQRLRLEHRAGEETREAGARERSGQRRFHTTWNDIQRQMSSIAWDARWANPLAPRSADGVETQLRAYRASLDVLNRRSAGVTVNPHQVLDDEVIDGQARAVFGAQALSTGFELRNESLEDPGLPGGRSLARHRSAFVQDEWSISPQLTLTAGLRHDRHSLYGAQWSPRAYLVWKAAPGWTLKGGYSHGFKAPNLKQIVPGSRAEGPNTVIGNPDLTPEISDGVEIGLGWERGRQQGQLVVFSQRVKDLIELRLVRAGTVPGTGTYVYENLAEARLHGLEAAWQQPLLSWLGARLSYTYLDARNAQGQRLERRPRHSAALSLEAQQGPWRASLMAEHTGRQLLPSATVGAAPVQVSDATLLGAHLTRSLPAGLSLSVGVRNLGDVRLADRSPLFTQVEAPRTWRVALRGQW